MIKPKNKKKIRIVQGKGECCAFAYQISQDYAVLTALYNMNVFKDNKDVILLKTGNNIDYNHECGRGGLSQVKHRTEFRATYETNLSKKEALKALLKFWGNFYGRKFYLINNTITDMEKVHSGSDWCIVEDEYYDLHKPRTDQMCSKTTIQEGDVIFIPVEHLSYLKKDVMGETHFKIIIEYIHKNENGKLSFHGDTELGESWTCFGVPQDYKLLEKFKKER